MTDKEALINNFPYKLGDDRARETVKSIVEIFESDPKLEYYGELAYILATAYHESAHTFNPGIREIGKGIRRKYGIPDPETTQTYYGRGLCQLTWKDNYQKFSDLLGIDLVNNPDLALATENSIKILIIGMRDGLFTGNKLIMYINKGNTDYVGARKTVNGLDKANMIVGYAKEIYKVIENSQITT